VSIESEKEGGIKSKQKSLDTQKKKKKKPSGKDSQLRVISNYRFTRRTSDMACLGALFLLGVCFPLNFLPNLASPLFFPKRTLFFLLPCVF